MKSILKVQEIIFEFIFKIVEKIGFDEDDIEFYGKYKVKISLDVFKKKVEVEDGKVILVIFINLIFFGEGKMIIVIGFLMVINRLGFKFIVILREFFLGLFLGLKGGVIGGGVCQILFLIDINFYFIGDIYVVIIVNNFFCAVIDNYIYYGNSFGINLKFIIIKRVMDMNDRSFWYIIVGFLND